MADVFDLVNGHMAQISYGSNFVWLKFRSALIWAERNLSHMKFEPNEIWAEWILSRMNFELSKFEPYEIWAANIFVGTKNIFLAPIF